MRTCSDIPVCLSILSLLSLSFLPVRRFAAPRLSRMSSARSTAARSSRHSDSLRGTGTRTTSCSSSHHHHSDSLRGTRATSSSSHHHHSDSLRGTGTRATNSSRRSDSFRGAGTRATSSGIGGSGGGGGGPLSQKTFSASVMGAAERSTLTLRSPLVTFWRLAKHNYCLGWHFVFDS